MEDFASKLEALIDEEVRIAPMRAVALAEVRSALELKVMALKEEGDAEGERGTKSGEGEVGTADTAA